MDPVAHIGVYQLGHAVLPAKSGGGKSQHEVAVKAAHNVREKTGRNPVAFVHNYMAEHGGKLIQVLAGGIDNGHGYRTDFISAVAGLPGFNVEELGYSFPPLMKQFPVVDDYQCRLPPFGDDFQGHHRFARAGSGFKHSEGMPGNRTDGFLLVGAHYTVKGEADVIKPPPVVLDEGAGAGYLFTDPYGVIDEAAGKIQPLILFMKKIELGFELLADPPAVASGSFIFWVANSQFLPDNAFLGFSRPGKAGLRIDRYGNRENGMLSMGPVIGDHVTLCPESEYFAILPVTAEKYSMPNTLVHLCIQTPASRLLIGGADFKWIALGSIIPDIPWILQRIIAFVLPGMNLLDLRLYSIILASLFFCLLFSLALSLITVRPGRIFLLLALNALMHLTLDALQTKWGNGVHFFAPFSWKVTQLSSIWPEHPLIYFLSGVGLCLLIYYGIKDWKKSVRFTMKKLQWVSAALLVSGYFFLPFLMFQGPEIENNHFVATLRKMEQRPGKSMEIDRRKFRGRDNSIQVFSGERLRLHGNIPDSDALLSVRGNFIDATNIQVDNFHRHNFARDLASLVALTGIVSVWLLAILRNKIIFTDNYQ